MVEESFSGKQKYIWRCIKIFDGEKYVTRGVIAEIPLCLQVVIWEMIHSLPVEQDYLQVFTLSAVNGKQKVVHSQECPQYEREYLVETTEKAVDEKIFVIDDTTHCTMLLSNEY